MMIICVVMLLCVEIFKDIRYALKINPPHCQNIIIANDLQMKTVNVINIFSLSFVDTLWT